MDLKWKIEELKEKNDSLGLTIQRTRYSVKRIKLEYAMLLERLEQRIDIDPELNYHDVLPTMEIFKEDLLINPLKRTKKNNRSNLNNLTTNFNHTTTTTKAKERDPNLPKRPTNAYLIYCEMNKSKLKENGSLDVTKDLSEAWKKLNEIDRSPYYNLYIEDKKRYDQEMEIYNSNKLKILKGKEIEPKVEEEQIDNDNSIDSTNTNTNTNNLLNDNNLKDNSIEAAEEINDSQKNSKVSNIKQQDKPVEFDDDTTGKIVTEHSTEKSETESNTTSEEQKLNDINNNIDN